MPTSPDDRRKALLAKFRAIAQERLGKISRTFLELERQPNNPDFVAELLREVHTLKGEARLMGFLDINLVTHRTEDLLHWARDVGFKVDTEVADLVFFGLDKVAQLLASEAGSDEAQKDSIQKFVADVERVLAARNANAPQENQAPAPTKTEAAPAAPDTPAEETKSRATHAPQAEVFVRLPVEKLAVLTNFSGNLLLRQDQLDRLVSDLDRLVQDWSKATGDWKIQLTRWRGIDHPAVREVLEGLEGRKGLMSKLAAFSKEMLATVGKVRDESFDNRLQLKDLQENIREMRLLQLGSILERYPRAVRDMAREQGKQIRLHIQGAEVAVDKQVLDRLDEPLLHLVRNSVDHGLETPDERQAQGKPAEGILRMVARQTGGHVEIVVADDGRGLDPKLIRASLVKKGILSQQDADAESDDDIVAFIFRAGFSTRGQVTDLSGRGVGLDVVKQQVEMMGGSVRWESQPGQGARFILSVPVSVALTNAVLFHAHEGFYAVASTLIEHIVRIDRSAIKPAGEGYSIDIEGKDIPLYDLSVLLGGTPTPTQGDDQRLNVLVLRHGNQSISLTVKRLIGERQAVLHALDPFVAAVHLISGTAVLEGGRLVQFLNVPELFRVVSNAGASMRVDVASAPKGRLAKRRILIVDDSELTRDMLVSLAARLGLETFEAIDGQDGWAKILASPPDLVMTDLDMPVMDGFALIEKIRADGRTRDLPVVVLSTRGSDSDKRRAMEAGANSYVVKSAFREADLIRTLEPFLQ